MYELNENFFSDVTELAEYLEYEFLIGQDDYYTIEVYNCDLESIGVLDAEVLALRVFDEDRFSEDATEYEDLVKIFNENIDFEKINNLLPKMWYPSGNKVVFTKQELLESLT